MLCGDFCVVFSCGCPFGLLLTQRINLRLCCVHRGAQGGELLIAFTIQLRGEGFGHAQLLFQQDTLHGQLIAGGFDLSNFVFRQSTHCGEDFDVQQVFDNIASGGGRQSHERHERGTPQHNNLHKRLVIDFENGRFQERLIIG